MKTHTCYYISQSERVVFCNKLKFRKIQVMMVYLEWWEISVCVGKEGAYKKHRRYSQSKLFLLREVYHKRISIEGFAHVCQLHSPHSACKNIMGRTFSKRELHSKQPWSCQQQSTEQRLIKGNETKISQCVIQSSHQGNLFISRSKLDIFKRIVHPD